MESREDFFELERMSYFDSMDVRIQSIKEAKQNSVLSIDDIEVIRNMYPGISNIESLVKTELHSFITGSSTYIYDTVYLAQNNDEYIHRDSVKRNFIPKGTRSIKNDAWYDLSLTIGDSLSIDSLKVREKLDVILGWKKPDKSFKWLRKREPIVSVQSYNPYTEVGYVNNLVVRDERSKFGKVMTSKPMMFIYGLGIGYAGAKIK